MTQIKGLHWRWLEIKFPQLQDHLGKSQVQKEIREKRLQKISNKAERGSKRSQIPNDDKAIYS